METGFVQECSNEAVIRLDKTLVLLILDKTNDLVTDE